MVRGLCSPWKQPIFYALDQDMTFGTLSQVIRDLERLSLKVVAAVSDMAPKNETMWKLAGVTPGQSFARHPVQPDPQSSEQEHRQVTSLFLPVLFPRILLPAHLSSLVGCKDARNLTSSLCCLYAQVCCIVCPDIDHGEPLQCLGLPTSIVCLPPMTTTPKFKRPQSASINIVNCHHHLPAGTID